MSSRTDFGDPAFEPTGEQLQQLSHEAFADVPKRNREALARLRAQIDVWRREALTRVALMLPGASESQ